MLYSSSSWIIFPSVGGGGGFVDNAFAGSAGGAGSAGTIDLALNGSIAALGGFSTALFAQSSGANGLGGKGFFYVSGTVSDVQAAIEAGREDALKRGVLTRSVVVPRLHAQMKAKMLGVEIER